MGICWKFGLINESTHMKSQEMSGVKGQLVWNIMVLADFVPH